MKLLAVLSVIDAEWTRYSLVVDVATSAEIVAFAESAPVLVLPLVTVAVEAVAAANLVCVEIGPAAPALASP